MGIMDKLTKRRPRPTAGAGGEAEETEEVKIPEVDDTLGEIDRALAARAEQTPEKRSGCCGCFGC